MKSKIKYILMMVFSFLFFFSFSNQVSADDTIEYDTYIFKYDYADTSGYLYKNKTYTLNIDKEINAIDYVTYEFNVINNGTSTIPYGYGTYLIRDNVLTETEIRFEDELASGSYTSFVIINYDVNTVEEMMSSLINVSFYDGMVDLLNVYLNSNLDFAYTVTDGTGVSGYNSINSNFSYKYSYLDSNNTFKYNYYSLLGLPALTDEVVFSNTSLIRLSDMYTITDLENAQKKGYDSGFADGEVSVDITSDNDTVINLYIKENELLTKEEGEAKYEAGFNAGKEYVYGNLDVDVTVNDYISKNYYTKEEVNLNYELGVSDGKEYIYSNLGQDTTVNNYVNEQIEETIVNKTVINVVDEHNYENSFLIKKYDVNYSDTGDFTINIFKEQNDGKIQIVEETKVVTDQVVTEVENSELAFNIFVVSLIIITTIVLVSLVAINSTSKKGKVSWRETYKY